MAQLYSQEERSHLLSESTTETGSNMIMLNSSSQALIMMTSVTCVHPEMICYCQQCSLLILQERIHALLAETEARKKAGYLQ